MERALNPKICLIGSGNVATHLGVALSNVGSIVQVYSYNISNAEQLAKKCGCKYYTDKLEDIIPDADIYLVAIKDDAIADVAALTPQANCGIWAHTSGSVPMNVFSSYKSNFGVFYPLQTFSRELNLNVREVPIFIEGNSRATFDYLSALARQISDKVAPANSDLRKKLHVAAVFACNFVNLMWIEADELLCESGLSIEFLKPLLTETLRKLDRMKPEDAQTGPARRGDRHIIDEHLKMLSDEKRQLYSLLSDKIINRYCNE